MYHAPTMLTHSLDHRGPRLVAGHHASHAWTREQGGASGRGVGTCRGCGFEVAVAVVGVGVVVVVVVVVVVINSN